MHYTFGLDHSQEVLWFYDVDFSNKVDADKMKVNEVCAVMEASPTFRF